MATWGSSFIKNEEEKLMRGTLFFNNHTNLISQNKYQDLALFTALLLKSVIAKPAERTAARVLGSSFPSRLESTTRGRKEAADSIES